MDPRRWTGGGANRPFHSLPQVHFGPPCCRMARSISSSARRASASGGSSRQRMRCSRATGNSPRLLQQIVESSERLDNRVVRDGRCRGPTQERNCAGLRMTAAHSYSPKDAVGPLWVTGESDDQCRTVGRQCGDVQRPAGNDGIAGGRGLTQATWRGQIDEPDASLVGRMASCCRPSPHAGHSRRAPPRSCGGPTCRELRPLEREAKNRRAGDYRVPCPGADIAFGQAGDLPDLSLLALVIGKVTRVGEDNVAAVARVGLASAPAISSGMPETAAGVFVGPVNSTTEDVLSPCTFSPMRSCLRPIECQLSFRANRPELRAWRR